MKDWRIPVYNMHTAFRVRMAGSGKLRLSPVPFRLVGSAQQLTSDCARIQGKANQHTVHNVGSTAALQQFSADAVVR